jgi:uncharacterized membrane protein YbhN (UPF0104 family)
VGVALVVLVQEVGGAELVATLLGADAGWALLSLLLFLLPVLGNAMSLRAVAPLPLPWGLTTVAQLATTVGNLVTPANLGGLATTVRYLQRRGVPTAGAAGAVGAVHGTSVLLTVVVAVPLLATSGRLHAVVDSALGSNAVTAGAVVAALLIAPALLLCSPRLRHRAGSALRAVLEPFRRGTTTPGRMGVVMAGHAVALLGTAAALAAALRAFDASLPWGDLILIVSASGVLAGVVPVPGGAGAAELVLAAQLTAAGLDPALALTAAVLYRLVSFYARVPVGWAAFSWLRRAGHL